MAPAPSSALRCVVIVAAIACRSPRDAVPTAPHEGPPSKQHALVFVRQAERAHAVHLPLDYRRPFERAPVEDSPAVPLYLQACRAGDEPSCWLAMQIAAQDVTVRDPTQWRPHPTPRWREAATLVEANCLAGHHPSCVALPAEDAAGGLTFPTAPGAVGRSVPCRNVEAASCPQAPLRAECDAGFARSCRALAGLVSTTALQSSTPDVLRDEGDALVKRANDIAVAGCRERVIDDCIFAAQDARAEVKFIADEHWCELGRICSGLSERYLERGDTVRARDAAERGCQYFANRCAELGALYLDGTLPEPIVGRGQALLDFVCDSVRRSSGEDGVRGYKVCHRAKLAPLDQTKR